MAARHVTCPACGTGLRIPEGFTGSHARCGQCHHPLEIPSPAESLEDTVVSWLDEDAGDGAGPAPEAPGAGEAPGAPAAEPAPPDEAVEEAPSDEIRLVKLHKQRVLFEFPTRRLRETAFRCAMPRLCLQCGTRAHLHAHVVIFSGQMVDSVSLEAEHSAGAMELSEEEVRHLDDEELLEKLPHLPGLPSPADLPMPYWLCDMCSSSGVISAQILGNPATDESRCRLLIRNMRRAAEFMVGAGGEGTGGYAKLMRRIEATTETPWDQVPLVVQHRIDQWYHPGSQESFLAYVPDRDHVRTEDGMAGLVLSNCRLIYHTKLRHRESTTAQPLEMELSMSRERGRLQLKTPSWEVSNLAVDRDGIGRLRRALMLGKFQATLR